MAISYYELEAQALGLRAEDRAHLLEKLIESFEPTSTIEKAWVSEAIRRQEEVKSGQVKLIQGEDLFNQIKARIT